MSRRRAAPTDEHPSFATGPADRAAALVAGGLAFALYAATACRTIFGGDSAELAAAAALFGVPHPPGYPLYTLTTGVLVHLTPLREAAFAANLASGLYGACAVALLVAWMRRIGTSRTASGVAGACLALGSTYWSQCTVAEVYSFDVLLLMLVLHALPTLARSRRTAGVAGLVLGLWLGHRPLNVVYLPALAFVASAFVGWSGLVRRAPALLVGLLASALPYAYLPIASSLDPAIDVGDPQSLERFGVVVSGQPYLRHLRGGTAELALSRVGRFLTRLPWEIGPALILAPLGVLSGWSRAGRGTHPGRGGRRMVIGLVLLFCTNVLWVSRYNILDIEVYRLPALVALVILGGRGAERLLERAGAAPVARRALAVLLLVAGAAGLPSNLAARDLSWNRYARWIAEDTLASVEPDALLFVGGDTSIHGLWYLQAVEGARPDVVVVSPGHLHPWYVEQLAARHPADDWPELVPGTSQGEMARAVLDRLVPARPAYHSPSVQSAQLLRRGVDGSAYGTLMRGVVYEILPFGTTLDARQRTLWNAAFFERVVARLGEPPRVVDMDSKSVLVQYALGLATTAGALERFEEVERARELYRAVLRLDPDRHQRDIEDDVRRGLGQEIPRLRLGQQAARALAGP